MKKLLFVLLLVAVISVSVCANAQIIVAKDGEINSLTQALALAQDGDEIVFSAGVYDENCETFPIIVDKKVTIRAAKGETPIIQAPMLVTTMKIKAAGVTIEGIDLRFLRYGFWVLADDVTISDCTITMYDEIWREASCGLWLGGGKRMTLRNNSFVGCGVGLAGPVQTDETFGVPVLTAMFEVGEDIEFFTTHTFENNVVNDKPLIIVIGLEDTEFSQQAGQVIAVACENTVFHDMDLSKTSLGMQFYYCNDVTARQLNTDYNGVFGVYIAKSSDVLVEDCTSNNSSHGVDVRDAANVIIRNVQANDCGQGIFLSWGHNCFVTDCEMNNCGTGFFSASGNANQLYNSRITGCELGIYVQHEPLFTVSETAILNNTSCGTRVTDTGLIGRNNSYDNNFVSVMALGNSIVQLEKCTFLNSQNRAVFVKDGKYVQLIHNSFGDTDLQINEYINTLSPVIYP